MQVDCPECGASLAGNPGAEMVCPACMTPFLVPSLARAVRAFDVQPAGDAVVLHALSRHAIREAIYTGRFDASARVRHDGGKWELIGGYPEFAAVFRLLGGDLAPMAGTRKLAGWGRGRAEGAEAAAPRAPSTAPAPPPAPTPGLATAPTRAPTGPGLRTPTIVPPPPKDAPPPPLPAATAPATAAAAAAVADAESAAPPAPAAPAARPVARFDALEAPNRVPLLVGLLVVLAIAVGWAVLG